MPSRSCLAVQSPSNDLSCCQTRLDDDCQGQVIKDAKRRSNTHSVQPLAREARIHFRPSPPKPEPAVVHGGCGDFCDIPDDEVEVDDDMLNCEDDDTKRARVMKSTLLWSKKLILGAERSNVVPSLLLKIKRSMSMKILVAFMWFVKKFLRLQHPFS